MSLDNEVHAAIAKLAEQAGQREHARALVREASAADAERCAMQYKQEVHDRLTGRFRTTGELPSGITADLAILTQSNPGRVAPPVITITNCKFNLLGPRSGNWLAEHATELAAAIVAQAKTTLQLLPDPTE